MQQRRERDFLRRSGKPVAARNSTTAFDETAGSKVIENLLQEALGDVLSLGNRLDANDALVVSFAQYDERTKGVFAADG